MKQLTKIFDESINIFLVEELENIEHDIAERNLCGRLAIYLTDKLRQHKIVGYYADTEYNRKQNGQVKTILDEQMNIINIQCDLIVHSRGNNINQDNLIAIEMKKSSRPNDEKEKDRKRLRALTKESYDDIWSADGIALPEHVCGYLIGVYMELDLIQRECLLEFYSKGEIINKRIEQF